MSNETRDSGQKVSSSAQGTCHFVWPLSKSPITPDEMNTSFGPRIDADRWDFHDGIDSPATLGTPVHAMADGMVHRAGPADETGPSQGFGSTHVLLKVCDPTDRQNYLFLVYLHLDSIAEGVIRGLLRQDLRSPQRTLIRAGLRFALPVDRSPARPMSWRLGAAIEPAELDMNKGLVVHPLAFLAGDDVVAAACLRKIRNDEYIAGVLIRAVDGLFRERIDVTREKFSGIAWPVGSLSCSD